MNTPDLPLAPRLREAATLINEAAHALEQCAATIAMDTARARKPMTEAQIAHLVTEFHRTRRFHGNEPADIVRAVETFHGIRAEPKGATP